MESSSLLNQVESLYAERETLLDSIGVADAKSIVNMIRSLEAQLRDLYASRENGGDGGGDGDLASMEMQLRSLYQEREELETSLGVSDARGVVGMMRNLEAQLRDLYQEKESGAEEAVAVVQQIKAIATELGNDHHQTSLVYENEKGPSRWAVTWKHD